jgi:acetyl-CoA synthetase
MTDPSTYPVPAEWAAKARVDAKRYDQLYGLALADPGSFWLDQAKRLDWIKRPEIAGDWSFDEKDFRIRWFADGKLNVAANCIDRHLARRAATRSRSSGNPTSPDEAPRATPIASSIRRSAASPMC